MVKIILPYLSSLYVVYIVVYLFLRCLVTIKWIFRAPPKKSCELNGVSIIKPLFGYDENLKSNLESFFRLDYPKYELLLCIGEEQNSRSLKDIKELRVQYPLVDVKVFKGGIDVGPNPKICNMMQGYQKCKYSFIWFSDSSIYTPPDNLSEMMAHMSNKKVALVHQLPFVRVKNVSDFSGYVDMVFFGTQYARICLLGNCFNFNCANGMSSLVRMDALKKIGGLAKFSKYMAEDYFIPQDLMKRGWKLALSTRPAMQNRGKWSTASYQERVIRWTAIRMAMVPLWTLLEPFSECFFNVLIGSFIATYYFGFSFTFVFVCFVLLWILFDVALLFAVTDFRMTCTAQLCAAWLYREMTTYWWFLCGVLSKNVTWGGKKYQLLWGGKARRLF